MDCDKAMFSYIAYTMRAAQIGLDYYWITLVLWVTVRESTGFCGGREEEGIIAIYTRSQVQW